MSTRRVPLVLLTAAMLFTVPAAAFADDDDDDGRGRHRHRNWKKKDRVVYVTPAPVVVVPRRVVVAPPRGYVFVPGHYEAREQVHYVPGPATPVWVPPQFGVSWADGRLVQVVLSPGHYQRRPGPLVAVREVVQVWVPDQWVPAGHAVAYWGERD